MDLNCKNSENKFVSKFNIELLNSFSSNRMSETYKDILLNNDNINVNDNNLSASENQYKKELIGTIINNFCKYLKSNGYSIKKDDNLNVSEQFNLKSEEQKNIKINKDEINIIGNIENKNCTNEIYCKNCRIKFDNKLNENKYLNEQNLYQVLNENNLNIKKAWLCDHNNRIHYAKGKCRNCYINLYKKKVFLIINMYS